MSAEDERVMVFTVRVPYYGKPEHGDKLVNAALEWLRLRFGDEVSLMRPHDPIPKTIPPSPATVKGKKKK